MQHAVLIMLLMAPGIALAMENMTIIDRRLENFSETRTKTMIISRDEIELSGATNLSGLMESYPGFRVMDGHRGKTLTLYGVGGKYIKIMINGVPLLGRLNGEYDISRIKLDRVERIEIIKGPSSSLHGSDAMAGTINIITRWGTLKEVEVMARGGSLGERGLSAQAVYNTDDQGLQIQGDRYINPGYERNDDTGTLKTPDLDEVGLGIQFSQDLGRWGETVFVNQYQNRRIGITDANPISRAVIDRSNDIHLLSSMIQHTYNNDRTGQVKVKASYDRYDDAYELDQRGANILDTKEDTLETSQSVGLAWDEQISHHSLSAGFDQTETSFDSDRVAGDSKEKSVTDLYIQDEVNWRKLTGVFGTRLENDGQFGQHQSSHGSLAYQLTDHLQLSATYSEGFRAPSFKELYMNFVNTSVGYEVTGNQDLEPETSQYTSLNLEGQWTRLRLALTVFQNDFDNLIVTTLNSESTPISPMYRYENIQKARYQGYSAELQIYGNQYYSMKMSHSEIDSRDRELDRQIQDRPRHRSKLAVTVHPHQSLDLLLSLNHFGKRVFYREAEDLWQDPYVSGRLAIQYKVNQTWQLGLVGDNLLDEGDARYLPIKPRSYSVSVRARY
ncbi:TonB-dependent receptor plug domain-containing protein [Pseudobacteriovorax antillogorgiicola]|uniref:Outer membrane receptor for ferrienterochelin and colicins n=1 Tax=Pseudobacteriovorax antillogorgiicola TaxID=1513793 RepID=A0A1Y6CBA1_9BACT|nr:TonB-dependent receptor [Pseudobacteriovorax antillogorgiicola]TCS49030.1 outer membrane receptor for ferrienterochelin and colicins [Pseudobacteriovorax antillogorgiicola]SMF52765.1 outer membrane receptor for ferrienterochelin and colicins [Pseudobacteriovorax antillogorgiicola]